MSTIQAPYSTLVLLVLLHSNWHHMGGTHSLIESVPLWCQWVHGQKRCKEVGGEKE